MWTDVESGRVFFFFFRLSTCRRQESASDWEPLLKNQEPVIIHYRSETETEKGSRQFYVKIARR